MRKVIVRLRAIDTLISATSLLGPLLDTGEW
jgi:hypothetical protein